MLGSTPITAVLGAAPPADADTARLKAYAKAATGVGLALLLIAPNSKLPVDMRSSPQKRKDDAAAQDAAKAAGRADYLKARSLAGAHLATTDATLLGRYIEKYRKVYGEDAPVNFAIEVGRSKLVIVDCDTAEQVTAFLADAGVPTPLPPTVRTPGAQDADGSWAHKDGGHFYFTTDEVIDTGTGSYTAPGQYVVMWKDRYVLIPPSVRPEGTYQLAGREYPVPEWIVSHIQDRAALRAQHAASIEGEPGEMNEAIDAWADTVPWADILAPLGWSLTARPDRCGCDVWTAPGVHASPKSATTHDTGCELGRYTAQNAPMHIWTDNPGEPFEAYMAEKGTKTLSKLQAVALVSYEGNVGTACAELGFIPGKNEGMDGMGFDATSVEQAEGLDPQSLNGALSLPESTTPVEVPAEPEHETPQPDAQPVDNGMAFGEFPDEGAEEPDDGTVMISDDPAMPTIAPFDYWRGLPPVEYAVEGLIEHKALTSIIGPPGIGKSTVAIDLACSMVTGSRWQGRKVVRQRVLYLPGEGLAGAAERIKAWELAHEKNVGQDLLMGNAIIQLSAKKEAWERLAAYVLRHRVGMIIFDTFARMALGLEENSATDVGKAITRFDQIRKLTGSGVMVIHHTAKNSTVGRGSSALNGALDTELLVLDGTWDASAVDGQPMDLYTSKQKNAARLREPLPLLLAPMHDSVVVTGPTGQVGDPLDTTAAAPLRIPEPIVETAIRLYEYAVKFPMQGCTRGDFVTNVVPDEYTLSVSNSELRWKRVVSEAVDLGLRYGLLETLTGTASGSRFIKSVTDPEAARLRAAQEAMTD